MSDLSPESLESALGSVFGDEPAEPVKEPVAATEVEEAPEVAEPVESAPEDQQEAAPEPELELEIEIDGRVEVIRGKDAIKELAQKGKHFSQGTEWVAREREALAISRQQQEMALGMQQALQQDFTQLRALQERYQQFANVDWSSLIDTNFTEAMKLQEQRNSLREAISAKERELQTKTQQFEQKVQQGLNQRLVAEEQALLAKVPEWRNSERGRKETTEIKQWLLAQGYTPSEVSVIQDHRAMVIARMAWKYATAGDSAKAKQVRQASPTAKPGVQVTPKEKAAVADKTFRKEFRQAGRQGNHRAQEQSLLQVLNRTFK